MFGNTFCTSRYRITWIERIKCMQSCGLWPLRHLKSFRLEKSSDRNFWSLTPCGSGGESHETLQTLSWTYEVGCVADAGDGWSEQSHLLKEYMKDLKLGEVHSGHTLSHVVCSMMFYGYLWWVFSRTSYPFEAWHFGGHATFGNLVLAVPGLPCSVASMEMRSLVWRQGIF